MVKVTGPCFSLDAQGSLGGVITYQRGLKSRTARLKPIQRQPGTSGQIVMQDTLTKALAEWNALLPTQQAIWIIYTDSHGNKGYHAFMSQYISRTHDGDYQFELPPNFGYCIVDEVIVGDVITGGVFRPI